MGQTKGGQLVCIALVDQRYINQIKRVFVPCETKSNKRARRIRTALRESCPGFVLPLIDLVCEYSVMSYYVTSFCVAEESRFGIMCDGRPGTNSMTQQLCCMVSDPKTGRRPRAFEYHEFMDHEKQWRGMKLEYYWNQELIGQCQCIAADAGSGEGKSFSYETDNPQEMAARSALREQACELLWMIGVELGGAEWSLKEQIRLWNDLGLHNAPFDYLFHGGES